MQTSESLKTVTLRPIRPQDDEAVAQIIRQTLQSFGATGPGFAIHDPEVPAMSAAYQHARHCYWVLDDGHQVLGGAGVAPLAGGEDSVCELRKMYLLPEARGRGLGEMLLRECLSFAKTAGFERCYLETLTAMTQAQKLYQKLGFAPLPKPMGATGHFGCDRWFAKSL